MQTTYVGSLHSQAQIMSFQPCFMCEETLWSISTVCLPLPDNWMNQVTNFHEIWYDHHPTWSQSTFVLFNFLTSIIPTWWLCELPNVEWHRCPLLHGPEIYVETNLKMVYNFFIECNTTWQPYKIKFSFQSDNDKYWSIWENVGFITSNCSAYFF